MVIFFMFIKVLKKEGSDKEQGICYVITITGVHSTISFNTISTNSSLTKIVFF